MGRIGCFLAMQSQMTVLDRADLAVVTAVVQTVSGSGYTGS
jgi:hypothetical protein